MTYVGIYGTNNRAKEWKSLLLFSFTSSVVSRTKLLCAVSYLFLFYASDSLPRVHSTMITTGHNFYVQEKSVQQAFNVSQVAVSQATQRHVARIPIVLQVMYAIKIFA